MSARRSYVWLGKEFDFSAGLSVGIIRSFSLAISLFALASIVFAGELEPYVLAGTGIFFIGCAILSLFLALFGKFPAPVATTPIPAAIVMITIAQSIDLQGRELYLTYIFTLFGCALLTGVFFLLIGYAKAANFFRFVPFTVSAGALAGSGILILLMALRLAGLDWRPSAWPALLEPMVFANWFLSIAFGVVFVIATQYWRKFWVIPALFAGFCVVIHLGLIVLNISIDEATLNGLFLNVDFESSLWPAFAVVDVSDVRWGHVASQIVNGTVLFIVLLILTVVSFAQLELGANMELDWNREFKLHGVANLLAGAGGGCSGATVASSTLPHITLDANTPATSIVIAAVLLLFTFLGSDLLRLLPLPVTCAFLISISVPLISDWLFKSRKRLQIGEYAMLLLICATIVFVGFLEAIALGLVLSLVLFTVRLSQTSLVASEYTVADRQSRKLRSIPDQSILKVYGPRAKIFRLRGYVFFGSAYAFAMRLKDSLAGEMKLVCKVIDFDRISGFDLSALDNLRGFIQRAKTENVAVVLSSTTERLEQEIRRDFPDALINDVIWADSEEDALIEAEELLLKRYEADVAADPGMRDLVRLGTTAEVTAFSESTSRI